jgi:4-phytase/acid phosphatase
MVIVNNYLKLFVQLLIIAGFYFPCFAVVAKETEYTLQQVVILSRHGVRSPTKQSELVNEITPDKWPEWPVKPGYLTPRGEQLVTLMGEFYGDYFRNKELLPKQGCPVGGTVYVQTDVDQRTILTGQAFLVGITPYCGFKIHHQKNLQRIDPLFHPVEAGVCTLNSDKVLKAVQERLGSPLDTLSERYANPLIKMVKILKFNASPYCGKMQKLGKPCNFATFLPNEIHINKKGTTLLHGPFGLSSTLAEIFLLQSSQGMSDVAWHRLNGEANWTSLLSLHNVQFDLMDKTFYIASYKGTPLLEEIDAALIHQIKRKKGFSTLLLPAYNHVLFLVGHDVNIANIAGMLGLNWHLPHQPDNTPPGGGLVFELWRKKDSKASNEYFVSVKMFYQTMIQLKNKEKMDLQLNPAGIVIIAIPGCDNMGKNKLCRLDKFREKLKRAIEPICRIC